jgi:hypothetical protein
MPATVGRRRRREASLDLVRVRVLPDGRLDRRNAALYLGRSPKTLAQWALQGRGPPPHKDKVSGRVFYYLDDLDACKAGGSEDPPDVGEAAPALHGAAEIPALSGSRPPADRPAR